MQKDGEDESLRRYKEALLGAAANGSGESADANALSARVVFHFTVTLCPLFICSRSR